MRAISQRLRGLFRGDTGTATARPLISVHVPKSGGTSFSSALFGALGRENVLHTYDDPADPTHLRWICPDLYRRQWPRSIAPHRAVHGHIIVHRYDLLPEASRITLLRDPVDTMVSIHAYWTHLAAKGDEGHALFTLFKREKLSVLDVASMPLLRYLLSRTYFGDYDMKRFDVIGDFRHRPAFFAAVSRLVGAELDGSGRENVTPYSDAHREFLADASLMRRLRDLLIDDVRFYERHAGRGT